MFGDLWKFVSTVCLWLFARVDQHKPDREASAAIAQQWQSFAAELRVSIDKLAADNKSLRDEFEKDVAELRAALRTANDDVAHCEQARAELVKKQTILESANAELTARVASLEAKLARLSVRGESG